MRQYFEDVFFEESPKFVFENMIKKLKESSDDFDTNIDLPNTEDKVLLLEWIKLFREKLSAYSIEKFSLYDHLYSKIGNERPNDLEIFYFLQKINLDITNKKIKIRIVMDEVKEQLKLLKKSLETDDEGNDSNPRVLIPVKERPKRRSRNRASGLVSTDDLMKFLSNSSYDFLPALEKKIENISGVARKKLLNCLKKDRNWTVLKKENNLRSLSFEFGKGAHRLIKKDGVLIDLVDHNTYERKYC